MFWNTTEPSGFFTILIGDIATLCFVVYIHIGVIHMTHRLV